MVSLSAPPPGPFRTRTPAPHRGRRAGILAVVVVYLAVLGHLTGGGMVPDLPSVALALALTWPVCWQLATTRRGFPTILLVLTLAQPVLHLVLTFGGVLLTGTATHAGGHHSGSTVSSTIAVSGQVPAQGSGSGLTVMLAFHAVAALITAVVLARGERALTQALTAGRRIAGWVLGLLTALAAAPAPQVHRTLRRPDTTSLPAPLGVALPARHGRRGPPRTLGVH